MFFFFSRLLPVCCAKTIVAQVSSRIANNKVLFIA